MSEKHLDIYKLLRLVSDPVSRQHLIDFEVLKFEFSHDVKKALKQDKCHEDYFYRVVSEAKIDDLGSAQIHINGVLFWMDFTEMPDVPGQSQNTIFVWFITNEENEELIGYKNEAEEWLASGSVCFE
jgi:hypothetical protein